jgi:hypothetical protein
MAHIGGMAKHKSVTHLPALPASATPAPAAAPLAVQLMTMLSQLVLVGVFLIGVVTLGAWLFAGFDVYARMAQRETQPRRQQPDLICFRDRQAVEWCRPVDRPRRWPVRG